MSAKVQALRQLDFPHVISAIPIWMLTHTDMHRMNRVSVFKAYIVEALRKQLGYRIQ